MCDTYQDIVADHVRGCFISQFKGLKDLLLTYWCQIPQTFRGLVESVLQWITAKLAAHGGPIS